MLRAIALAMGVPVIVLTVLNSATTQTALILLGIGVFALSIGALSED